MNFAYYNEMEPYAAQWLRNLIESGHIAPGIVDERSIEDVCPYELREFKQCHFFAGVGVWSLALRRAGWPDDKPVWTGSCPCQPFSAAGKAAGFDDKRHLWPHFHWLISQLRPGTVFGEQVASKDAEPWIDLVQADLEAMDYAFGAVAFPSAGVGAPHIRDRTYWVADNISVRFGEQQRNTGSVGGATEGSKSEKPETWRTTQKAFDSSEIVQPGQVNGAWSYADWLSCRDGKWRPVEPGTFPLANGASNRVGRLRAYGNAINAEAAKEFIAAYIETALVADNDNIPSSNIMVAS